MQFYVYALFRDDDQTPFYVGKGSGDRMHDHRRRLKSGKHTNQYLQRYVNKMWRNQVDFSERILVSELEDKEALALEADMIRHYRSLGYALCNLTNGGDGPGILTEDHREKISASLVGKSKSEQTKKRMSIAQRNNNSCRSVSIEQVKIVYCLLSSTRMTFKEISDHMSGSIGWSGVRNINAGTRWSHIGRDLGVSFPIRKNKFRSPPVREKRNGKEQEE